MEHKTLQFSFDHIRYLPGSHVVFQPRFVDPEKKRIRALVQFPDNSIREIEGLTAERDNPFVRDVFSQYSEAEIELFTFRERIAVERRGELERQAAEDRRLEQERNETFRAKEQALNLPQIQNSGDKELLRKIRRSSSAFEVQLWASLLLAKHGHRFDKQN